MTPICLLESRTAVFCARLAQEVSVQLLVISIGVGVGGFSQVSATLWSAQRVVAAILCVCGVAESSRGGEMQSMSK